jgi:hypothetical protein
LQVVVVLVPMAVQAVQVVVVLEELLIMLLNR